MGGVIYSQRTTNLCVKFNSIHSINVDVPSLSKHTQIKGTSSRIPVVAGGSERSEQASCCGFSLCLVLQDNRYSRYRVQQLWKAKILLSTNNLAILFLSLSLPFPLRPPVSADGVHASDKTEYKGKNELYRNVHLPRHSVFS